MKKYISIICLLIVTVNVKSQEKKPHWCTIGVSTGRLTIDSSLLLADETTMDYSGKVATIYCYNKSIAKLIQQRWGQLITETKFVRRKGREGKHYIFNLNKEDAQYIVKWSKINL